MNGPVFRHAVRASIRTTVIVSAGLGLFVWVIMASSASFAGDAAHAPPIFLHPPRAMVAFLGGAADLLHASGWLAAGMVHPVVMSLSTVGAFLVTTATGVTELERGTLDLVLSRPVSRSAVLSAKIAATLVVLTIIQAGGIAGAFVARATVRGVDALSTKDILLAFAGQWLLFATFAMAALWIFAGARQRSRAMGAAVGVLVGAFFVNFVSLLFSQIQWLGYLTPFHYFRAADVLNHRPIVSGMLVLMGTSIALGALAVRTFRRRDLTR